MGVLGSLLGSKSQRDIKTINPIVNKIKNFEESIAKLSNDELRGKTSEFKQRIADYISEEEKSVAELKEQIEKEEDIMQREKLWEQVDKHEHTIYERTQEVLNEILPEAFAVMKETGQAACSASPSRKRPARPQGFRYEELHQRQGVRVQAP
jgi:preprotein translocase subunit SecA